MTSINYRNLNHKISFRTALSGIKYAFSTQPNFLVMFICAIIALFLSIYLQLTVLESLLVIWTIFLVFMAEMMNTAVEAVTDLVTEKWSRNAKIAKDVSSGMVLFSVIGAIIIGIFLFLPKLLNYL